MKASVKFLSVCTLAMACLAKPAIANDSDDSRLPPTCNTLDTVEQLSVCAFIVLWSEEHEAFDRALNAKVNAIAEDQTVDKIANSLDLAQDNEPGCALYKKSADKLLTALEGADRKSVLTPGLRDTARDLFTGNALCLSAIANTLKNHDEVKDVAPQMEDLAKISRAVANKLAAPKP